MNRGDKGSGIHFERPRGGRRERGTSTGSRSVDGAERWRGVPVDHRTFCLIIKKKARKSFLFIFGCWFPI